MKNRILFAVMTIAFLSSFCLIIGELILRFFPIPGVSFYALKYNDLVGRDYYPNSDAIYSNDRGDYVKRKVNRWGFLDVEHNLKKKEGVYRIGFFGDSYTEAMQVPIDSTFFSRIEKRMQPLAVECLAFGLSGRGTVHSYLLSKQEMTRFALDMIVYVFCENDVGDQISQIKKDPNLPYVKYENGMLTIDQTFRDRNVFRKSWVYDFYQYIKSKSVLIYTVRQRLGLLLRHGVNTNLSEDDRLMMAVSQGSVPDQNDPPSTWPDALRNTAQSLAIDMLLRWREEVITSGRLFALVYIPRASEWKKQAQEQDSWKSWLQAACWENGISFIDPTDRFSSADSLGRELYYDHLTPAGHESLAQAFLDWFKVSNIL